MFKIAEPAILPAKPVSPDRVKVILMGILAGLAGGIGIIVLLDAMDHSVKSSKAIRDLGLPVLAIIPKIQSDKQLQREKIQDGIFYCIAGCICCVSWRSLPLRQWACPMRIPLRISRSGLSRQR
jgi:hypothetical protein